MRKIHCVEINNNPDKKFTMKELNEMIGWIEPPDTKDDAWDDDTWDVTMADGCGFSCKNQSTAIILAGIEEIKAMMMKYKLIEDKDDKKE